MDKPRLTVIGAGVIGLTSAVRLQESGYDVTILARELHPEITSSVAAALWFPYAASPPDRVDAWSIQTFRELQAIVHDDSSGAIFLDCRQVSDAPMDRPGWSLEVGDYRELMPDELPESYTHGYHVTVPLVQTPTYLPYLMNRFESAGGDTKQVSEIKSLDDDVPGDIVINCSGLGAKRLCSDPDVYPIKGQVVIVENPGLDYATCDDESAAAVCYVIPRETDCVLGGIAVDNDWNTDADQEATESILRRCRVLEPALGNPVVRRVAVGLRPGRTEVRLESEILPSGRAVVHNYGHGGAGFTLSWGCADEVLELVEHLRS